MGLCFRYSYVSVTEMVLCLGLKNGGMFEIQLYIICRNGQIQKWGSVSVTEMVLCLGLINGGMFEIHKWGYTVTEMGLCSRYRNGLAMFRLQKWGYVSVTEMGLCLGLINARYVCRGGTRQGGQRRK